MLVPIFCPRRAAARVVGHPSQDRRDRLLLVPQPRAQSSLSATAGAAVSSVCSHQQSNVGLPRGFGSKDYQGKSNTCEPNASKGLMMMISTQLRPQSYNVVREVPALQISAKIRKFVHSGGNKSNHSLLTETVSRISWQAADSF